MGRGEDRGFVVFEGGGLMKYQVADEYCTVQSFVVASVYCALLGWSSNGQ
jgi:hypothetical protein